MSFIPMTGKVLLRPREDAARTEGGIIIPESARGKKNGFARVVEVGAGVEDIAKGDLVFADIYAGQEIRVEGEDLRIVSQDEVLAIAFGKE